MNNDNISHNLNDLVDRIRRAAESSHSVNIEEKEPLTVIFAKAISLSLEDVSKGCDPEDFAQVTIVNFSVLASREGYKTSDIRGFVKSLNT